MAPGCEIESASTECSSVTVGSASNNVTGLYTCQYFRAAGAGKTTKLGPSLDQQSLYIYVKGTCSS
jgi:hypothetical protein